MPKKKLIPKVTSLYDLRVKAKGDPRFDETGDPRYEKLAIVAASNLGKAVATFDEAMKWLSLNANETDEDGVVGEINFVRDLV